MSESRRDEDFYVGYLDQAPPSLARFVRGLVVALAIGGAVIAALLVVGQSSFPAKVFEWSEPKKFLGYLQETPVESLLVRRPGRASPDEQWTRYLLVAPGKRGARGFVEGRHGELAQVEGSLIYRESEVMVEAVSVTPLATDEGQTPYRASRARELGKHTLVGEIVDSKCYLGVMAPGSTKPHRACAARCISGGIPPVFLVRQDDGRAVYLLLLDEGGANVNERVLPLIAEPLEITGVVERHDDLLVLKSDPSTYRRLGS